MTALHELGVVSAAEEIASGRLAARELVEALLRRAEEFAELNAFVTLNGERIRAEAQAADDLQASGAALGPLHGIPIAIKDNIETRDDPTTAGSNVLRGFMAKADAPVVVRLKAAGAIPFGKTGMHEFAFGVTSNNAAFGAVRNPFNTKISAGGSSGGSGAAVGGRLAPAAIGTDTGGSVRIPAAFCGCFGLRPTLGRWPTEGIVPLARSRDTPGPMARSMRDLALIDQVITGDAPHVPTSLKGKRIGVPDTYLADLNPEVQTMNVLTRTRLSTFGATLVKLDLSSVWDLARATHASVFFEAREELTQWFATHIGRELRDVVADIASPDVAAIFRALAADIPPVTAEAYAKARDVALPALKRLFTEAMQRERLDAIAYPTTPARAPLIGEDESIELNGRNVPTLRTLIRHVDVSAAAGLPALNVPIARDSNLVPIGMELVAAPGQDRELISLGLALQQSGFYASVLDWRQAPPM